MNRDRIPDPNLIQMKEAGFKKAICEKGEGGKVKPSQSRPLTSFSNTLLNSSIGSHSLRNFFESGNI